MAAIQTKKNLTNKKSAEVFFACSSMVLPGGQLIGGIFNSYSCNKSKMKFLREAQNYATIMTVETVFNLTESKNTMEKM